VDRGEVKIIWVSGHFSEGIVIPPVLHQRQVTGYDTMGARTRQLWSQGYTDAQIAETLSADGFRSARRDHVLPMTVLRIRNQHHWVSRYHQHRLADKIDGMWTIHGLSGPLGVGRDWFYHRIRSGFLRAPDVMRKPPSGNYLIRDDAELRKRLRAEGNGTRRHPASEQREQPYTRQLSPYCNTEGPNERWNDVGKGAPEQCPAKHMTARVSLVYVSLIRSWRVSIVIWTGERRSGESLARNQVIRVALAQWLATAEAPGGMSHPDVLRQHFQAGYNALRSGNDAVQIHRLRQLLGWPPDRFDALVEQLRAESKVVLYTGDPRHLSDDEQQQSYEVNGQLYLSLAWKD
jgi:hypothetical protein